MTQESPGEDENGSAVGAVFIPSNRRKGLYPSNMGNAIIQVFADSRMREPMIGDSNRLKRWLGIALFILSFAFYGFLLLVPFTPISAESRIALSAAVVILAESSFLLSVILLGREAIAKYRGVGWRSRLSALLKRI